MGELNIIEKSLNTLRVSTLSPTNHLNSITMSNSTTVKYTKEMFNKKAMCCSTIFTIST